MRRNVREYVILKAADYNSIFERIIADNNRMKKGRTVFESNPDACALYGSLRRIGSSCLRKINIRRNAMSREQRDD